MYDIKIYERGSPQRECNKNGSWTTQLLIWWGPEEKAA